MMFLAILGIIALALTILNLPIIITFIHNHLGILSGLAAFVGGLICLSGTDLHKVLDKILGCLVS